MNIGKALELFEIDDISLETKETLKKKYRLLMRKYHPDNYNGDTKLASDITSANEILIRAVENAEQFKALHKKSEVLTIVIPLSVLIQSYCGEVITIGSGNNKRKLSRVDIKKNNTLIIVEAIIEQRGIQHEFSSVVAWNINDKYDINCEIFVESLAATEDIVIRVEDKKLSIPMESSSVKTIFTLSYGIKVGVTVTKKLRKEEESDNS
jgi:hypothetical protein